MVEGEITLIDDAGEHLLKPGMCAGFKAGVANGHHLVNKIDCPCELSGNRHTRAAMERAHYPDVDMLVEKDGRKITVTQEERHAVTSASCLSISGARGKA